MMTKHDVEKLIVAKPGVATPNAGDKLFNDSTKVFNLGVGGIGAYIEDAGSGNPVALDPSSYAGQPVRFIQVRDTTGDAAVLPQRVLEQSQPIHGNCSLGMEIAGEAYSAPANSAWTLGAPNATSTGNIEVVSNNQYNLKVTANGYRTDMFNSQYNHPTIIGFYESPNWLDTSISTENNRRDYTVKSMVQDFNRKASVGYLRHAVAMVIDTAGTTSTGTQISSISAGDTITIGYDHGCTAVNLYVTDGIAAAFANLETMLTTATASGGFNLGSGAAYIAPYALPEHCSTGEIAGDGSATGDMIFVVALDQALAAYDEIPQTKTRLEVGLDQGLALSAASRVECSQADEGAGLARNIRLMYNNVEHYKSYTSSRDWGANHVAYPDEIISSEGYDFYTITHCHNRVATSGGPSTSTLLTAIALVNFENTDSAYYDAGNPNPQKTYVESVINAIGSYNGVPGPINL